ncbi:glutaredoxin family protein [Candidatus Saccharibacteria bacterium]|nr:glutaredoxin family protein [Candidatus Saccharibacteria bacterium]
MITIYTTPTCIYCHALMEWLDSMGIEYVEKQATRENGFTTVPVTIIGGKKIVGFDRPAIRQALAEMQK